MQEAIASCNHESIVILADFIWGEHLFNVAVINAQKMIIFVLFQDLNLGMVIEYSVSQLVRCSCIS